MPQYPRMPSMGDQLRANGLLALSGPHCCASYWKIILGLSTRIQISIQHRVLKVAK